MLPAAFIFGILIAALAAWPAWAATYTITPDADQQAALEDVAAEQRTTVDAVVDTLVTTRLRELAMLRREKKADERLQALRGFSSNALSAVDAVIASEKGKGRP